LTDAKANDKAYICYSIIYSSVKLLLRTLLVCTFAIFNSNSALAQFQLPDDTVLCPGQTHYISSGFKSISSSTTVSLTDDQFSGVIPIGFPFDFYGQTYTDLVISSNNYVTFDLTVAGGFSGWQITANIPNAANAQANSIMCPWQDVNPGTGGIIEYGISGSAPNRVFTISFCEVPMFSCTGDLFTNQILLFEGSHRIETHIRDKPVCTTWNGGVAIHGLQNATGTQAHVIPGRNFSDPVWTTSNEGYAFIPDTVGIGYSIQQVPYDPSVFNPIQWFDDSGSLFATGDSLQANFPANSVNTFRVQSSICGGAVISDTITIYTPGVDSWELQPSCDNEANGVVYIDLFDQNPYRYNCFLVNESDSIVWASSVQRNGDTAYAIPPGKYAVVVTDTNSCLLTDTVIVGSLGGVVAEILPVADTLYDTIQVVQTFDNLSTGANSYFWTANGQTSVDSNATFIFDSCGTYWITLESENALGCSDSTAIEFTVECYVPEPPPPPLDTAKLIMPNVFTPNGDNQNDYFNAIQPTPDSLMTFEGVIFNRYGQEMYRWQDWRTPTAGWDGNFNGQRASDGVYFYRVVARDKEGQSLDLQGIVHLNSGGLN
jgi:gliding motility-associated-like protein